MIGAIGFPLSRNEIWKKSINLICNIFMKKSFVFFKEHDDDDDDDDDDD